MNVRQDMKKIVFFLALSCLGLTLQAQPAGLFAQGNEAYRQGDYQQAIESYTAVLDAGFENADLYYNLGNAYYRTDQYGLAVLNYERALRLRPRFAEAQQNLNLANARTDDKITPLPEFLLARWYHLLVGVFSPTGWLVVVLVIVALALLSAGVVRFSGSYGWRKGALVTLIVLAFLFVVTLCCTFSAVHRFNRRDRAVVTQPMVVVKGSPDENGVDKLILHDGTAVVIDETLGDWHKIHLADGNTGWIHADEITVI